jgi:hypothetical protein
MKAERRHDLETNSLARILSLTPGFFRQHGAKVLLGVVIVTLAIILMRQRSSLAEQEVDVAWGNISAARQATAQLTQLPREGLEPDDEFNARLSIIDGAGKSIKAAMASDNAQLVAEALVAQGDFYWTLANLPEITRGAAATQPAKFRLESTPQEYLAKAQETYEKVLKSHKDSALPATIAQFGLAAIAENRGDWAAATRIYETLSADPATTPAFKSQALYRIQLMDKVKRPLFLATTRPASAPVMPLPILPK